METVLEWIDNCNMSRFTEYMQSMQNVNSTLAFDEECDLSLLHVVSGYESPYRDKAIRCIFETKLAPYKPRVDVNHKSGIGNDSWTAAHICAGWNHHTTLKLLLEYGADPRIKDRNGNDVLEIARAYDNFLCINVLQEFLYGKNRRLQKVAPTPSVPTNSEEAKRSFISKSDYLPDANTTQSEYFTCSSDSENEIELNSDLNCQRQLLLQFPKLSKSDLNNCVRDKDTPCHTQVSGNSETPVKPFDISLLCQSLANNTTALSRRMSASKVGVNRVNTNLFKKMEFLEIDDWQQKQVSTTKDENFLVEILTAKPTVSESNLTLGDLKELVTKEGLMTDDESGRVSPLIEKTTFNSTKDIVLEKAKCAKEDEKPKIWITTNEQEPNNSAFDSVSSANDFINDKQNASGYIRKSLILENTDRSVELYEDRQFGVSLLNESRKSNLNYRPSLRQRGTLSGENNDQVASPSADSRLAEDEFMQMKDFELRSKLLENGLSPGPINSSTKGVYVKKLRILMQRNARLDSPHLNQSNREGSPARIVQPIYTAELNLLLNRKFDFFKAKLMEQEFQDYFERSSSSKVYFCYFLLDPRITQNLVDKAKDNKLSNAKLFEQFVRSIFYIGKGQGNRPFMHLYEAALLKTQTPFKKSSGPSAKLSQILEIWDSGHGVISLHCFHSISSPEALTRECFMINTIGIKNLTNIQIGQNRLRDLLWTDHRKNYLGAYLLYKAFNLLLVNGERQIRKADVQR